MGQPGGLLSQFCGEHFLAKGLALDAGDNGSSDAGSGAHADFPASSPHSLGCGGTTLEASGGTVTSEVVWDDGGQGGATGGGVSDVFALPDWQDAVGVPDKAGTQKTGRGGSGSAAARAEQEGIVRLLEKWSA